MTSPNDAKRLKALVKLEENKFCADCGSREPRWASANLGVFICLSCSGIHRSLGVHISFVRSVNLDAWKKEQVDKMERVGNARAKAYYLSRIPPGTKVPNEYSSVQEMERWIRDKYEHKKFISQGSASPSESSTSSSDEKTKKVSSKPTPKTDIVPKLLSKPKKKEQKIEKAEGREQKPAVDLLCFETTEPNPKLKELHNDSFFGDFQAAQSMSQVCLFGEYQNSKNENPTDNLDGANIVTSSAPPVVDKTSSILNLFNNNSPSKEAITSMNITGARGTYTNQHSHMYPHNSPIGAHQGMHGQTQYPSFQQQKNIIEQVPQMNFFARPTWMLTNSHYNQQFYQVNENTAANAILNGAYPKSLPLQQNDIQQHMPSSAQNQNMSTPYGEFPLLNTW